MAVTAKWEIPANLGDSLYRRHWVVFEQIQAGITLLNKLPHQTLIAMEG